MLALARMRAHAGLFASLFGVTALLAAILSGTTAFVGAAEVEGTRAGLAAETGAAGAVRASIRYAADDPAAQDSAVRSVVDEAWAGADVLVTHTVQSEPVELDARGERIVLLSGADLRNAVELTEGQWIAEPLDTVVQGDAAQLLGIDIGNLVSVPGADGSIDLTVVGVWRALDAREPRWLGDPLIARGNSGAARGPFVIDEADWALVDTRPFAQWTVQPDATHVQPSELRAIADSLPTLAARLEGESATAANGVVVSGELGTTIAALERAAIALSGISPMPIALVIGVGVVTLIELARLLIRVRADETTLLRSRGTSARRLVGTALAESASVSVPAAVLGAGVGALVASLVAGGDPLDRATIALAAVIAGTVVAVAIVVMTATVWWDARRTLQRDTLADSGRASRVAGFSLIVLSLTAAVFALVRFRVYGSAVVPTANGGATVDPVAVLAPTLAIVACAVVAVAIVQPLASLIAGFAANRKGLLGSLAARQVARRAAVYATPVLLMSLAVSGLTVAAVYDETWQRTGIAAQAISVGSDVRVSSAAIDGSARRALGVGGNGDASSTHEVTASPGVAVTVNIGDDAVELLAFDSGSFAGVVTDELDALSTEKLITVLSDVVAPGVDLPPQTSQLAMNATVTTDLVYWLLDSDSDGAVQRVVAPGGSAAISAAETWRILAVDIVIPPQPGSYEVELAGVVATTAVGIEVLPLPLWQVRREAHPTVAADVTPLGDGTTGALIDALQPRAGAVRLMPQPEIVPVVVTAGLAERIALDLGDTLSARLVGSSQLVTGTVALIVDALPATSSSLGAAVDLASFAHQQLADNAAPIAVSDVWLSAGDDPTAERVADVVAQARQSAPPGSTIVSAFDRPAAALLGAARTALWIGALGAALLAFGAVAAVADALVRARAVDVVVLRALGSGARLQARGRAVELASVLVGAVIAGLAGGALVAVLTVRELARSAVLDAPPGLTTVLAVDVVVAAVMAAVLGALLTLLVAVHARRVHRQVRVLSAREVLA